MLAIHLRGAPLRDQITRREVLRLGGLSAFGRSLSQVLAGVPATAGRVASRSGIGRAKACIVLWMTGGPPQHETWDPKPDAPAEIRGPFGSIATNVPGIRVGELMPRTARLAHRLCILRAVHTDNPSHPGSSYEMLTGVDHPRGKGRDDIEASRNDWPSLSAVVKRFKPSVRGTPTAVVLPEPIFNVPFYPGQDAGFLGPDAEPWRVSCDPSAPNFTIGELTMPADVSLARLGGRHGLLDAVGRRLDAAQRGPVQARHDRFTAEAFALISGNRVRTAFDLGREAPAVRDRYGRHKFGQGCLLARRLIEAGVTFVQLNWHRDTGDETPMWDFHWRLEENLKAKMPPMDQGYTALLDDLDGRGLLSETLVVWVGEFGRTPKLEYIKPHPQPGRNHWGHCFSMALAGAGVRGGQVYGASDKDGGHPRSDAVTPADLTATLFSALGLSPDSEIRDRLGRPHPISRGRVLTQLW
jgi:hypothetical protein